MRVYVYACVYAYVCTCVHISMCMYSYVGRVCMQFSSESPFPLRSLLSMASFLSCLVFAPSCATPMLQLAKVLHQTKEVTSSEQIWVHFLLKENLLPY